MEQQRQNPLSPDELARLAHAAVALEAATAPKPGLVCPNSQGAHADMDYALLLASADSLSPYFRAAAELGATSAPLSPPAAFTDLRALGLRGERAMLAITKGVNTHKGQVFSLGLLLAATARLQALAHSVSPDTVRATAASFIAGMVERELASLRHGLPERKLTAGEQLYLRYGVSGARGEAEAGFPAAARALERLNKALRQRPRLPEDDEAAFRDLLAELLLTLICDTEDTNLLWRGGEEGLCLVQAGARTALDKGGMRTPEGRAAIRELELACEEKRLSPGGAADLLAVTLYLFFLDRALTQGFSSAMPK